MSILFEDIFKNVYIILYFQSFPFNDIHTSARFFFFLQ